MTFKKLSIIVTIILIFSITNVNFSDSTEYEVIVKYKNNKNFNKSNIKNTEKGIKKLGYEKRKIKDVKEYKKLLKDSNIEHIEFNKIYKKLETTSTTFEDNWWVKRINLDKTLDITNGSEDIVIAIIDTGVDLDHPDLVNSIISGKDYVNNDMVPQDDDGHGTAVAGVIVANSENDIGIKGVASNCKIMPLKVLDNTGDGYLSDVVNSIIYAADNGVNIINLSLGGGTSQILYDAIKYAYDKGVVIVAASGNTNSDILYPAAYDEVIAVGSIDNKDDKSSFSNYGKEISIVSPGNEILTTALDGDLVKTSGTSISTPFVSGAAALILSINPNLTNDEVRWILESTSNDLGNIGFDNYFGYGVLDTYNTINTNIKYFDNYNDKRILKYLLDEIRLSNDNNAIDFMKQCFNEEDIVVDNNRFGIYKLKFEIHRILTSSISQNMLTKGIGSNYDELKTKVEKAFDLFLEWTNFDKNLLIKMIKYENEEVVNEILSKYYIYNTNDDYNNSYDDAIKLYNNITTEKFGMIKDEDFYKFNIESNTTVNFNINTNLNIISELYNINKELLYRSTDYDFNYDFNQIGKYYLKIYEPSGKWNNDNKYTLSISKLNNGSVIMGNVVLEGQLNNKNTQILVNDNHLNETTDKNGDYYLQNNFNNNINISFKKEGYLSSNVNIIVTEGLNRVDKQTLKYGDLNNDNSIDIFDIVKLSKNTNISCLDEDYNPLYDYNKDGIIDKNDIYKLTINYKKY